MSGWIKVDRGIQSHWIWDDHEKAYAWLDLLLLAEWETHKKIIHGELKTFERGTVYMSFVQLASRWGWSRDRVIRFIKMLEDEGMCTTVRTPKGSAITIVNYEKYQVQGTTDDTADETPDNTTDNTSGKTTDDTHLKNIKKYKEKKEDIKHHFGELQNVLLTDAEYEKLVDKFGDSVTEKIDDLSYYIGKSGKKYKSHYLTILEWARKDEKKQDPDEWWK